MPSDTENEETTDSNGLTVTLINLGDYYSIDYKGRENQLKIDYNSDTETSETTDLELLFDENTRKY